jgi:hypothetical protein
MMKPAAGYPHATEKFILLSGMTLLMASRLSFLLAKSLF